jgi:hypothetical protein
MLLQNARVVQNNGLPQAAALLLYLLLFVSDFEIDVSTLRATKAFQDSNFDIEIGNFSSSVQVSMIRAVLLIFWKSINTVSNKLVSEFFFTLRKYCTLQGDSLTTFQAFSNVDLFLEKIQSDKVDFLNSPQRCDLLKMDILPKSLELIQLSGAEEKIEGMGMKTSEIFQKITHLWISMDTKYLNIPLQYALHISWKNKLKYFYLKILYQYMGANLLVNSQDNSSLIVEMLEEFG